MTPYQEQLKKEWYENDASYNYSNENAKKTLDFFLSKIRERDEKYDEIFKWLLGENGEFPDLSQKPHYSFRTELRKRLEILKSNQ